VSKRRDAITVRSRGAAALVMMVTTSLALAGCGGSGGAETSVVIRDPDDLQVLTPTEIEELRSETRNANAPGASDDAAPGDTIPLEDVDPTERLFTAFGDFNGCMEDGGQPFRGDPRSDPALLEDTAYMEVIQRCAARTDIVGALTAFQEFNDSLNPDEVEDRNEQFLQFSECLEERDWTIEATPNPKGLLTPSVFESPDGGLNERDLRQCGSEVQTEE